jgi:DNA-binding NtrC family response regulator
MFLFTIGQIGTDQRGQMAGMVNGRVTILVVDDEDSIRGLARQMLESRGYEVLVAADSPSALRVADEHPSTIHLLLTDVMMPESNGLALAKAFLEKRPDTPVLYMSGFESETIELVEHGHARAGRFLAKPFTSRNLIEQVQALVSTEPQEEPAPLRPAEYRLENPARCPHCGDNISTLNAIGLVRTQTGLETLPARRLVATCPKCLAILPVDLTDF